MLTGGNTNRESSHSVQERITHRSELTDVPSAEEEISEGRQNPEIRVFFIVKNYN